MAREVLVILRKLDILQILGAWIRAVRLRRQSEKR
jgi:hypothetical protein